MEPIKEVTVFTCGDSSRLATWSNVPFFFSETLIAKGIRVNRVNIEPSMLLPLHRLAKLVSKVSTYTYFRSLICFLVTRRKIKKAVKQFKNSQADIFLTFSFSSCGLTNRPVVLFCDWTYDYHIRHYHKHQPDYFEKQSIAREDAQIKAANLVFSLFPGVTEYMQQKYGKDHIFYSSNVINSLYSVSEKDVEGKRQSYSLLFIGSKAYIEGARSLIAAFELLKPEYPLMRLHIVGMEQQDFGTLPENVFCYGYLNKGIDEERDLYYTLMREATVFVNTTPLWSAFSASIEAMYFYTPVIVTPYEEFRKTFGEKIDFGLYCEENVPNLIKEKITNILENNLYSVFCNRAHNAVKAFTWDACIGKIIAKIEQLQIEDNA
jgi:glycosyltransferase involved in cell wall biosynthesis